MTDDESSPDSAGDEAGFEEQVRIWARIDLARQHLMSASLMARLCDERELILENDGNAHDSNHRSYAILAVISAVCYIEAYINEVYAGAADVQSDPFQSSSKLDRKQADLLGQLWKGAEFGGDRLSILAKYQLALICSGKPRMDEGKKGFQYAKKLIDLRNVLVHYKPEWQEHDVPHKLEKALSGLFPENRIEAGSMWFPGKCLAAGCAKWACDVAVSFVSEWRSAMGVEADQTWDIGYRTRVKASARPLRTLRGGS